MGQVTQVCVPDIGDFKDVPIIEIMVKPGDRVAAEAPLVTLESDKASMEVPSPQAGVVKSLDVKVGDKVSEGAPILVLALDAGVRFFSRAHRETIDELLSALVTLGQARRLRGGKYTA